MPVALRCTSVHEPRGVTQARTARGSDSSWAPLFRAAERNRGPGPQGAAGCVRTSALLRRGGTAAPTNTQDTGVCVREEAHSTETAVCQR